MAEDFSGAGRRLQSVVDGMGEVMQMTKKGVMGSIRTYSMWENIVADATGMYTLGLYAEDC